MIIKDILDWLETEKRPFTFVGKEDVRIDKFSSLSNYRPGDMTWIKKSGNIPQGMDCKEITLAIIQEGEVVGCPNQIITKESKSIFFGIIEHFFGSDRPLPKIGKGTHISPEVIIGENVNIGHNCVLDGHIEIGDNTRIYHNATIINDVKIGEGCMIQSGVNIGHDGFGYSEDAGHTKTMVKHHGGVDIGDDVYIGGNTYIERGVIDDTTISRGCKIDGACVIGHNVSLGEKCSCVAGTIIYGSVQIGENVYIASATIKNQVDLGKNALIGMGSAVTHDVPANDIVAGVPAKSIKK